MLMARMHGGTKVDGYLDDGESMNVEHSGFGGESGYW